VDANSNMASGFKLVVEGRPAATLDCGALGCMGTSTFASSPTELPDLQIEVSNNLGNGSPAVCDDTKPTLGGVPAVNPFDFSPLSAKAINDLSCRFKDGSGAYLGMGPGDACTMLMPSGIYDFVNSTSKIQFCGQVFQPIGFPIGDTVVAARIRDIFGHVSQVSTIVIRVLAP
jgi:hypothetical protein